MPFEDTFKASMPEYFEPLPRLDMALQRMGADPEGDYSPSKQNLQKLMLSSFGTIPFESLDCSDYLRKVDMAPPHLFDKFVMNRRGGYCFEINGFFMAVLEGLGYDCIPLAGRLLFDRPVFGMMGHRTTVARIDGKRYLCDVGYGGGLAADGPIDIDETGIQEIGEKRFRIRHHIGALFGDITLVRCMDDGTETLVYTVYLTPNTIMDFVPANEMAEKRFRTRRVCRMRTETGHISVDGKIFRRKVYDEITEEEITRYPRLYEILVDEFKLNVPRISFSEDWPREFADYKL
ncbi:MAG: arylamine N-acetyltransferase [Oscillospiraceae bacterium]|nr:arylamine N-acetyltransferase [Oscillospiraceae bacterium]